MSLFLYPFLFFLFAIYSYAHTDPNLIYSSQQIFLDFQQLMWSIGLENRLLSTGIYTALILGLFAVYLHLIHQIKQQKLTPNQINNTLIVSITILIFANPGLSHDIFNYIFNAKMVVVYHANPHVQTALEFTNDLWTRYMHNVHTPAPYGYGWTALSLLSYVVGFANLKLTLLTFKLLMVAFFALSARVLSMLQKNLNISQKTSKLYLFLLNPLVLIETFANGHNDIVMMGLAVTSIFANFKYQKTKQTSWIILSILLMVLSVSIKFASIVLLASLILIPVFRKLKFNLSLGAVWALLMLLPLLTIRSQQFLPWYLIWSLTFIPLIAETALSKILIIFSFSSLMRYIPILYYPMFDKPITDQRLRVMEVAITFLLPIAVLIVTKVLNLARKK